MIFLLSSAKLSKPGQGFSWGGQWFLSVNPAQGVGKERDKRVHGWKEQNNKNHKQFKGLLYDLCCWGVHLISKVQY